MDTGADISIIKINGTNDKTLIDCSTKLEITGITQGKIFTMGTIKMLLNELMCEVHIVEDEIPIDTEGLIGWDVISSYKGTVDAARKVLEFPNVLIPFIHDERFEIPA